MRDGDEMGVAMEKRMREMEEEMEEIRGWR